MNDDQIETLMRAIKNTYPTFSLNEGVIKEWTKRLVDYDFKDVEKNFNNYVLNGNTQAITIVDLIKGLQTKKEKEPIKGLFYCYRCGRRYKTIEEMNKCEERDLRIKYIKKMSDKFGVKYTDYFGNLYEATLEQLNNNYDDFIVRIVEEQKKNPLLRGYELDGLMGYYKNVIMR